MWLLSLKLAIALMHSKVSQKAYFLLDFACASSVKEAAEPEDSMPATGSLQSQIPESQAGL